MSEMSETKASKLRRARPHAAADTNAVHDRLLQSMRVRLPGSGQWYSSVKPHDFTSGSQNYVRPHNGRARTALEIRPKRQLPMWSKPGTGRRITKHSDPISAKRSLNFCQ